MDIKNLTTEQKKDLFLDLVKSLKAEDENTLKGLLNELEKIDGSSEAADIEAWANGSTAKKD